MLDAKDKNLRIILATINNLENEITSHNQKTWKHSACELHMQYQEFVVWLELFSFDDMQKSHQVLCQIWQKHLEIVRQINICTWIYVPNDQGKFNIFGLENTAELLSGISTFGSIYDLQSVIETSAKSFH